MPWENKGGPKGPWGQNGQNSQNGKDNRNDNRSPWGSGGGSGGGSQLPPDIENMLKSGQDKLRAMLPGGSGNIGTGGIALLVLLAFLGWLATGFFTIKPDEVGVTMRLGRYAGISAPGLSWNPPSPLGQVHKVRIGLNRTSIGTTATRGALNTERLMLTGDENIIDIAFEVQWRVNAAQAADFVLNVQNPEGNVRAVAESAMREAVGRRRIQNILTNEQTVVANEVQQILQQTLDGIGAGIIIQNVQLLEILPPAPVREAFFDVNAAQQDLTRLQNEARTEANKIVPEAKGASERIVQQAEAYKSRVIAEAQGQASRFKQVYEEYKKAPVVTRERLYIETMENVMGGSEKIIIDSAGGNGVTPLLPLDQIRRNAVKPEGTK